MPYFDVNLDLRPFWICHRSNILDHNARYYKDGYSYKDDKIFIFSIHVQVRENEVFLWGK